MHGINPHIARVRLKSYQVVSSLVEVLAITEMISFLYNMLLGEQSLVLARYARTCSLHQSYGYDLFRASCPPPFQGQRRFALLFKFAPGEFVSHEHDRHGRRKCRTCRINYSATHNAPIRRDYLTNSCKMRVDDQWIS